MDSNGDGSTRYIVGPGARPPFGDLARALWGSEDFDSDGNTATPWDSNWTELTLIRRPCCDERIDVDPVSEAPLVLKVTGSSAELVAKAVAFLVRTAGGREVEAWAASGTT